MNVQFKKYILAELKSDALVKLIARNNPAYIANIDGRPAILQATGNFGIGDSLETNETGLPANRVALRTVIAFGKPGELKLAAAPVWISYRTVGAFEEGEAAKLMQSLALKLHAGVTANGKGLLQRKIDIQPDGQTAIGVLKTNPGTSDYRFVNAQSTAGFKEIESIDAAMGTNPENHQVVIGGLGHDGKAQIIRVSPYTATEFPASAIYRRMVVPHDSVAVLSMSIDRRTLKLTALIQFEDGNTQGFANEPGQSQMSYVPGLQSATVLRTKQSGLYAYNDKGEVVLFQRKTDGTIQLDQSRLVLQDAPTDQLQFHDVDKGEDGTEFVVFTGRKPTATGNRAWSNQAFAQ